MRSYAVLAAVFLGACGGGGSGNPPADSAVTDAAMADTSVGDTSMVDSASTDSARADAALGDGSHHGDGGHGGDGPMGDGARTDGGSTDAVVTDGAVTDAPRDAPAGPRALQTIHGCAPDGRDVVDLTSTDAVITNGPEYVYTPRCARVRVGQTVTFRMDPSASWTVHPLTPGRIVDDGELDDPTSPIPLTESGSEPVRVTFREAGSYGYYCTRHWLSGHVGALHVVP